jgi:hypothetical protein
MLTLLPKGVQKIYKTFSIEDFATGVNNTGGEPLAVNLEQP